MAQALRVPAELPYISEIACPKCGRPSHLRERRSDLSGLPGDEIRIFVCEACRAEAKIRTAQ